mmetsp:Transcript_111276/g.197056  ORF Transcript_111276/g.197056 Transcript_111276/m.197056 type:complete len:191 (-) Transcript_111276:309-881(-)
MAEACASCNHDGHGPDHVVCAAADCLDTPDEADLHEIVNGVFLGGERAAISWDVLEERQIRAVINCAAEIASPFGKKGVKYQYPDLDNHDAAHLGRIFDEAGTFIDAALHQGDHVLVHCFEGRSRSAAVIIAFLMLRRGLDYPEALELVQRQRPLVRTRPPSQWFQDVLQNLPVKGCTHKQSPSEEQSNC